MRTDPPFPWPMRPPTPAPPAPPRLERVAGLSLGPVQGRSALAEVRKTRTPDGAACYEVMRLHRWELRTAYTSVAADVASLFPRTEGEDRTLVIDATAVGTAADLFRRGKHRAPVPAQVIYLRAGLDVTPAPRGGRNVPEANLAADALGVAESGRLTFAPGVPFAAEVTQELRRFAARVGSAGRQRETDDLTFALAVALWFAEHGKRRAWVL